MSGKDGAEARVVLDANGAFDHIASSGGISPARVASLDDPVASVMDDLNARREAGKLPFYDLPYDETSIAACESLAGDLRDRFTTLVVLGIGGSALGTRAAIEAVPADLRAAGARRVEVLDNIDPSSLSQVLDSLDQDYPGIKGRIVDEQGELRRFVNVYVGTEDVRFAEGLGTATAEGAQISVIPAVAGG